MFGIIWENCDIDCDKGYGNDELHKSVNHQTLNEYNHNSTTDDCKNFADNGMANYRADNSTVKIQNRDEASSKRLLIHCANGSNRSCTVTIALMMHLHSWSLKAAYNFVKDKRRSCVPLRDNRQELIKWEKSICKENAGTMNEGDFRWLIFVWFRFWKNIKDAKFIGSNETIVYQKYHGCQTTISILGNKYRA